MWEERLSEFVTLFLVINPFEVLPSFLAVVGTLPTRTQRKIALEAAIVAFVVLAFFIFAGGFLLQQMHVPIRAFQISGGIVLFLVALDMVRGHHVTPDAEFDRKTTRLAIYPLAIPKIAGPAAILAVILVTDDDRYNLLERGATMLVLAAVMITVFVMLLAAGPISRRIGATGAGVIGRIMGMLLASMAVSLVLSAVVEWLGLPKL
jgi:multiple antibiotic resistance protein